MKNYKITKIVLTLSLVLTIFTNGVAPTYASENNEKSVDTKAGNALTGGSAVTLQTGTYTVSTNISFTNSLKIAENATVIIEFGTSNATLTATGNITSAAGISLPSSSTLIFKGSGNVNATGGPGRSGQSGSSGTGGFVDSSTGYHLGGHGGKGGDGASAPGVGIGGSSSVGGNGGAGGIKYVDENGKGGASGGYANTATGMGTLIVLDQIIVTAKSQSNIASGGSSGGAGGTFNVLASGGGGGAGGSSGIVPSIGGGASGGGGGGGGGTGGGHGGGAAAWCGGGGGGGGYPNGRGGSGGIGYDKSPDTAYSGDSGGSPGSGGTAKNLGASGGYGGNGGGNGSGGSGGNVYKATTATVTVSGGGTNQQDGKVASVTTLTNIITLDPTGGINTGDSTILATPVGAKLMSVTAPTRTGYIFKGYYSATSGGTKYYNADGTPNGTNPDINSNKTIYAQWEAITYTVRYYSNDGTQKTYDKVETYDTDSTYATSASAGFVRTGYEFKHWSETNGASDTSAYNAGEIFKNLTDTKDGIISRYARWDAHTYNVSYNLDGGTKKASGSYPTSATYDNAFQVSEPVKLGYKFNGWSIVTGLHTDLASFGANDTTTNTIPSDKARCKPGLPGDNIYFKNITPQDGDNVVLKANWSGELFDAELDINTSEEVKASTGFGQDSVTFGETWEGTLISDGYTLAIDKITVGGTALQKSEYTFDAKTGIITVPNAKVKGNISVLAKASINGYTISFNANGGKGSMNDMPMQYKEKKTLQKNQFTREGCKFLGWSLSPTATTYTYADAQQVNSLSSESGAKVVLYAVWQSNLGYPTTLQNGSFESIQNRNNFSQQYKNGTTNLAWKTTATDETIEIANPSINPNAAKGAYNTNVASDGKQFAELNANQVGSLYQNVATTPGMQLFWGLDHRGRAGNDTMQVWIGKKDDVETALRQYVNAGNKVSGVNSALLKKIAQVPNGKSSADIIDGNTAWGRHTGSYTVPEGQSVTMFAFVSVKGANNDPTYGNLLDNIYFSSVIPIDIKTIPVLVTYAGKGSVERYLDGVLKTPVIDSANPSIMEPFEHGQLLRLKPKAETGYTFNGGYVDGRYYSANALGNMSWSIGKDITKQREVTILFSKDSSIVFDKQSGIYADSEIVLDSTNTKSYNLGAAQKDWFDFVGWKLASEDDLVLKANDTINYVTETGDTYLIVKRGGNEIYRVDSNKGLNLIAQFEPKEQATWNLPITLDTDGGSYAEDTNVRLDAVNDTLVLKAPEKTGYQFKGWKSGSTVAQYGEEILFSISEGDEAKVKIGSSALTDAPINGITMQADWEANKYHVILNKNGGTVNAGDINEYTYEVDALLPTDMTRVGCQFEGWYDNMSFNGSPITTITAGTIGNLQFFAKWSPKSYDVKNTLTDVQSSNTELKATYGNDYETVLTPTKGHELPTSIVVKINNQLAPSGSYTYNASTGKISIAGNEIIGDLEISATAVDITYSVTAVSIEGGKVALDSETIGSSSTKRITYGDTITLHAKPNIDYAFAGWYTNEKLISQDADYVTNKIYKDSSYSALFYSPMYVTLDMKGATYANDTNVKVIGGTSFTLPKASEVTKPGYNLTGFKVIFEKNTTYKINEILNNEEIIYNNDINFKDTSSLIVEAQYEAIEYNVEYYDQSTGSGSPYSGSAIADDVKVYTTDSTLVLPEVTKKGNRFMGWYEGASSSNLVTKIEKGSIGNKKLYAKWTPKTYTIDLITNGGFIASGKEVTAYTFGTLVKLPNASAITRKGYRFVGWFDNKNLTGSKIEEITKEDIGNKVYYAKWELVNFKVSKNLDNVTFEGGDKANIENDYKAILKPDPIEGYNLPDQIQIKADGNVLQQGKDYSYDKVTGKIVIFKDVITGEIEITIAGELRDYDVSLQALGNGYVDFANNPVDKTKKKTIKYGKNTPLYAKENAADAHFAGWFLDGEIVSSDKDITSKTVHSNLSYTAIFYSNLHVLLDLNGGITNTFTDIELNPDETWILPVSDEIYRMGYVFDGWKVTFQNGTKYAINSKQSKIENTAQTLNNGSVVLSAQWKIKTYAVDFDMLGHGTQIESNDLEFNEIVKQPVNPVEKGYTFKGWYKDKDFVEQWDFNNNLVQMDTTLYAKWEINHYKVDFDVQSFGTNPSSVSLAFDSKIAEPTTPTERGYTFKGWYTSKDFKKQWDFDKDVVENDMVLYAKWEINEYQVSFDSQTIGTAPSTISAKFNTKIVAPTQPSEKGYVFMGWFKEKTCKTMWNFDKDVVQDNLTLYAKWEKSVVPKKDIPTVKPNETSKNGDIDTKTNFSNSSSKKDTITVNGKILNLDEVMDSIFTKEEQALIESGEKGSLRIEVAKQKKLNDKQKKVLSKKEQSAIYFTISVYKKIGKQEEQKVNVKGIKIEMTINAKELSGNAEANCGKYELSRLYMDENGNWKKEVVQTTQSGVNITFVGNSESTYILSDTGVCEGDSRSVLSKQGGAETSTFVIFNLLATIATACLAIWSFMKKEKFKKWNMYVGVILTLCALVLYVITFKTGTFVLFDAMSVWFALAFIASIISMICLKSKNEEEHQETHEE